MLGDDRRIEGGLLGAASGQQYGDSQRRQSQKGGIHGQTSQNGKFNTLLGLSRSRLLRVREAFGSLGFPAVQYPVRAHGQISFQRRQPAVSRSARSDCRIFRPIRQDRPQGRESLDSCR
jgi:hypothetical protein